VVARVRRSHALARVGLGLLVAGVVTGLGAAVDRFNHNLETSARFYPEVVSTHSYEDRVSTVRLAKEAGLEACARSLPAAIMPQPATTIFVSTTPGMGRSRAVSQTFS